MTDTRSATDEGTPKVGLPTLTALVVGSMIGSGVFLLPQRFGSETGVLGAIIAWAIAGAGMLMLAFVFQRLAIRKPDLDAGIFAYAKAGFGDYVGFNSAIGYWASVCAGNASYCAVITATLSAVIPAFGAGDTVLAVVVSAIGVWGFVFLVMRGVRDAAVINYIVTIAKLVPILVFVTVAIVAFKSGVFADNFWGTGGYSLSSIWDQVTGTMLIILFVFLGIEGASVYSRMARRREDVGRATIIGFLSVLSVFALVTLVSYGVMPQSELAGLSQPSVAAVLESVVGPWGSILIRVGVIVSVLGAYLAWTLMAAEVLYIPATTADMPRFLARTNRHGAPVPALMMAAGLITVLLVALLFAADALDFMLDLTAALSLIPYLLAAAYALKLTITRETYGEARSVAPDMIVAAVATAYTLFLIYAAGIDRLLLSCILYAPATALYFKARRERGLRVFTIPEAVLFAAICLGAFAGVVGAATGAIEI